MATKKKAVRRKPASRTKKARRAPRSKAISQEAMMEKWQAAMTPSDGHRRLEPMAGTFRAKTTFVMSPGETPQTSDGTSVHRFVVGGRYLEQVYKGTSMGMPFEGIGYTGYDNVRKRYVGTWMDSFSTGLMHSFGVGRPTANKMSFVAEAFDPSGKKMAFETILRVADNDHHSYEMWTKAPNGKKFRTMIVEYTRA